MTTLEKLNRLGFSQRLIERFFRPFFGGVFLNQDLSTSSRMFDFVFRMFSNDSVALPANGMQSIALQIADQLPAGTISTNAPVTRIEGKRVWMKSGESLEASQVVIACEAPVAARLLGEEPAKAEAHGVSCFYFASDKPPFDEPILVLNGEGRGPINSVCVPSQVATGYAPEGQSLISVTVLGLPDDQAPLHRAVVGQLEEWYGPQVKLWRHLKTDRIHYGLPKQPPPALSPVEKPAARDNGIFVCGDYLDTASIQGAMMSGRRAAESILESRADLASGQLSHLTLEQASA
jgi:phytoene dehydrogenase-like protein